MFTSRNLEALQAAGLDSVHLMSDAFYCDLVDNFGEHPGQYAAFDRLIDFLDDSHTAETWFISHLAFGLGLVDDAPARQHVEELAAWFLLTSTPADEVSND